VSTKLCSTAKRLCQQGATHDRGDEFAHLLAVVDAFLAQVLLNLTREWFVLRVVADKDVELTGLLTSCQDCQSFLPLALLGRPRGYCINFIGKDIGLFSKGVNRVTATKTLGRQIQTAVVSRGIETDEGALRKESAWAKAHPTKLHSVIPTEVMRSIT
jgi:hypothetical protein